MNLSSQNKYRMWDSKNKEYIYYKHRPQDIDHNRVFKNTMIQENVHDTMKKNRFIYEGDEVNIRDTEERFNCGGDNTIDNTGKVVWKDNIWQLHCKLNTDFSYVQDSDYYVPLEQSNTIRKIV